MQASIPAEGIVLGTAARMATVLTLLWMLVGEPWWGRVSHRRLIARLSAGDTDARARLYRSWTAGLWATALVVLLLAVLAPGFGLERLGLAWPHAFDLPGIRPSVAAGFVAGALVAFAAGALAAHKMADRQAYRPHVVGGEGVLAMLPRTRAERRSFAILAVTAGITEEIVWRGFLLAAFVALFPPLPFVVYVLVGAAWFGFAHLYQGVSGIVATAVVGAILILLYLATGSILLPIVVHALLDLRALLIRVDGDAGGVAAQAVAATGENGPAE